MNESEAGAATIPIILQRMALGSRLRSPASSLTTASESGGAFYSESSLCINSPADRSRLILAQPQMSPIRFIPFTGSAEKELSWALHDMYILSGYHLQVVQRPHKSSRQREREEIFKSPPCSSICNSICFFKKQFQTHHKFIELEYWTGLRTCRSILTNTNVSCRMCPQGLSDPRVPPFDLDFG